jgi:hypothetical protein
LIVGAALLMRVDTPFRLFGYPGFAILCFHWQTTALRCVTFGVLFPKETRCESGIEFKDI